MVQVRRVGHGEHGSLLFPGRRWKVGSFPSEPKEVRGNRIAGLAAGKRGLASCEVVPVWGYFGRAFGERSSTFPG